MFFRKRIDALIEYPPVITYSKKLYNIKIKYRSLVIQELNNVDYFPVYFACANNEWGKTVINRINQILQKASQTHNYLDFRLKWYDQESQALLKNFYQQDYVSDKKKCVSRTFFHNYSEIYSTTSKPKPDNEWYLS